jgi:hypothetical protein
METPTRLELKYCEGCGALCLRPADAQTIYCAACEKKLPRTARELREQGRRA